MESSKIKEKRSKESEIIIEYKWNGSSWSEMNGEDSYN